jgi:asparaginyl-tRNA synthetase
MILPGSYTRDLLRESPGKPVAAHGWVKTRRSSKKVHFIQLNDGSSLTDLQVVVEAGVVPEEIIAQVSTGACVTVEGELVASPGKGQAVELKAHKLTLHGTAPSDYPLQKHEIGRDKLRDLGHLRARTTTFSAVFRVRNRLAVAVHRFFQERGFIYVHTPLISVSDAEGAGSMFHVTAPDPALFHVDDLINPGSLAAKLHNAQDPLSQYLRGQLPENIQQHLAKYSEGDSRSELAQALVEGLNQLLKEAGLFDKERFAQVNLSEKARSLIGLRPQGEDLVRVNRLLLEEAYPNEIAKSQKSGQPPAYDNEDFFKRKTFLTVSGQLEAEIFAHAFANVYTFGPTFRAEHSDTPRHLAEFYMIEPEMAFCDLLGNQALAEAFLKSLAEQVLTDCRPDLEYLGNKNEDPGLVANIESLITSGFERITYTEAVALLQKANRKWDYNPEWGKDLQSEHERYLTEDCFRKPVIVTDYPRGIKAFYMRDNDDGKTVAAMDVLVPRVGEIIGGSQREERYDVLLKKIHELDAHQEDQEKAERRSAEEEYWWYLELRKFGGVTHSGFGMGFERMMMYLTGMKNIRDVIPFPRAWKKAEF